MRLATVIPLLILTILLLTKCSDDPPVEPPPPPPPDDTTSHEFTWEVDTLFFEGTTTPVYFQAKSVYATSSANVYMAGYTTGSDEMCWHWDGKRWKNVDLSLYIGRHVIGVDGTDFTFIVFLSFDPGNPNSQKATGIVSLDGNKVEPIPTPKGTRNRTCLSIVSRSEIYIGGEDGIQRYNGTDWEWMLDSTDAVQGSQGIQFVPTYIHKFKDGTLEFCSWRDWAGEKQKYYRWQWDGNNFVVIDTFSSGEQDKDKIRFGYTILDSGESELSASFGGIYKRSGTIWSRIFDRAAIHIAGYESNLFVSDNFDLWHYNGSTWHNILSDINHLIPNLQLIYKIYYKQGHIFISLRHNDITVVLHGIQQ